MEYAVKTLYAVGEDLLLSVPVSIKSFSGNIQYSTSHIYCGREIDLRQSC